MSSENILGGEGTLGLRIVKALQWAESQPAVTSSDIFERQPFPETRAYDNVAYRFAETFAGELTEDAYHRPPPGRLFWWNSALFLARPSTLAALFRRRDGLTDRGLLTRAEAHVRMADMRAERGHPMAASYYEMTAGDLERTRAFDGNPAWMLAHAFFLERAGDVWSRSGTDDRAADNFIRSALVYANYETHGPTPSLRNMDDYPLTIRAYLKAAESLRESNDERRRQGGLDLLARYDAMQKVVALMRKAEEKEAKGGRPQAVSHLYELAANEAGRMNIPQALGLSDLWGFDLLMGKAYLKAVECALRTQEKEGIAIASAVLIRAMKQLEGREMPSDLQRAVAIFKAASGLGPAEPPSHAGPQILHNEQPPTPGGGGINGGASLIPFFTTVAPLIGGITMAMLPLV